MGTLVLVLVLAAGCSRTFYRQQADADAYCLVDPKAQVVGAATSTYRIEVDPRSRMYDPNDPDREPMPPDDPVSHRYMEVVDRKKGSKQWNKLPRTAFVENPSWQEYLPRDTDGQVLLDMRGAVELALVQSPEYQSELEELYLSALDVSFERFRFDTQFFGGSEIFITADGRDRFGTGDSSTTLQVSPLRPGNRLRAERLTATGGEFVVGAANSLVWQFAGPNDYTSTTLLDFTFLQPLLRNGGRTQVLERLTIAERSLLANVRQMERYRRGFYLNVVTGRDAGEGPSRRGGFFGGSGLEGFAGVGGGGFGAIGAFGQFGGPFGGFGPGQGVGGGFTGGAGAQNAGGYIGLLQVQQQIRNQRANVAALRDSYEQLQASYDAGRLDRFQVDLARQALYNAQSQLLTAHATYETTLDQFKITLGLPPELPVRVRDEFLDQFNLLDPELEVVETQASAVLQRLRDLRAARQAAAAGQGGVADVTIEAELDALLVECAALQAAVAPRMAAVEADMAALDAALPQRKAQLTRLIDRPEVQSGEVDRRLFEVAALEERVAQRRQEFESLRAAIEALWARLEAVDADSQVSADALLPPLIDAVSELSGRLLELSLVQAGARLEAITFEPVELSDQEALLIASAYRRDWQNARAALVDTWRLIFFNANALRSDLNVVFSGDIGNLGDNPLNLRDTTGRLRAGIQFDAPLTRLAERNVYRQSLIEYQQARRNYYQFRDSVSQDLRITLRQVRLDEINFELRRAAVLVAISQVDLTQLRLSQPPPVGVEAATSPTTARDLVQSLSDLLNVQNDFLSVWVNYEVQRMALEFELGVMELDAAGVRRDSGVPLASYIAGAQQIRDCLCNATDLYPGVGQVFEAAPAVESIEGELVEPLRQPESLDGPDAEALPIPPPLPEGTGAQGAGAELPKAARAPTETALRNPAAVLAPASYTGPAPLPPVAVE